MPLPPDLPTITLTDTRTGPDGTPLHGSLTLTPDTRGQIVTAAADGHTIQGPVTATWEDGILTGPDGQPGITLLAADAPGINPQDWTYRVRERPDAAPGRTYAIRLTTDLGDTVPLADLAPAATDTGDYVLIPGPPGPAGGSYLHTQNTPAATWQITHSLGHYPNIALMTPDGDVVYADITHASTNLAVITFPSAVAGSATCT